ncbi:hypothetical protein [Photobacterium sp. GSS17]|uniref:hypothetical protein n=1 Tax=Photobacterium sp. GSS17 TaxID=3020715 RepID=UPI00235DE098|nr:hypothetical protein [Photobacterium sp. GSS17]
MKSIMTLISMAILLNVTFTSEAIAQQGMSWHGSGGWGHGSQYGMMYDPQTIESISGDVVSVDKVTLMHGMHYGVHLTVKTAEGNVSVHLGPAWYIENQDVKITPNDKVTIKGSRITFDGQPAMIAIEVRKGNEVLTLRDPEGYPVWSGWKRQ